MNKLYVGAFSLDAYLFPFNNFDTGSELDIVGLLDCKDADDDEVIRINVKENAGFDVTIYYKDGSVNSFHTTVVNINQDFDELFNGYINGIGAIYMLNQSLSTVFTFIENSMDYSDERNAIFLFRNNSSKNTLSKDLIFVSSSYVKYTRPIQYKQMVLDVKTNVSDAKYNYVYLTVLNRYYYITDAVLTNEFSSLTLREDVLMTFKDLIKNQTAYVERNQYTYDADKVDDYVTFDYDKLKSYTSITPINDILTWNVTPAQRSNFVLVTVWGVA